MAAGWIDRSCERDAPRGAGAAAPDSECRCLCGSLLARRVPRGVELKCRRCKRTLVVPLEGGAPPRPREAGS